MLKELWRQLFSRPDKELSWWQVILWWELRRIPYNAIVGLVALLSFGLVIASAKISPPASTDGQDLGDPSLAMMMVPFMVNACYTLGWLGELTLRYLWKINDRNIGAALFKLGITFSVLMMTFPAMFLFLLLY